MNVTFAGNPVTLVGEPVKMGDKAPDFTVIDGSLQNKSLRDFDGKVKILAVYPSIDTGVCAMQNTRFNNEANNLEDVVVLSISCDLPFAQKRFCSAEGLDNIITLSDHRDVDFGTKYGVLIKELRLLTRATFILDEDNVVRYVEYLPEITQEPDYDKALEAVKELL